MYFVKYLVIPPTEKGYKKVPFYYFNLFVSFVLFDETTQKCFLKNSMMIVLTIIWFF